MTGGERPARQGPDDASRPGGDAETRMTFRDHGDEPVAVPPPPGPDAPPFYVPIGQFQGETYRRNAFAAHTGVELDALVARTGLSAGDTVVDVGCGDGRHLRALALRGVHGVGVDVSPALVEAARTAAATERDQWPAGTDVRFEVGDARRLADVADVPVGTADVAWTLCQGAFGTHPATDRAVLAGVAGCVRPGGLVVATAFHALFAVRHLVPGDAFDPVDLVHHQVSEVRGPDDARARFDLWTAAYTVRDLHRLCSDVGLQVVTIVGAEPGRYDATTVALDDPELLLVARRIVEP